MGERTWGILAAGGEGARLGGDEPKAFRSLAGIPMLAHSLLALARVPAIEGTVLVVPATHVEPGRAVASAYAPGTRIEVVGGGSTRQESVRAGLAAVPPDAARVLVHDAARPLVTAALIEAALRALATAPCAVAAVPVADTLKRADAGRVVETVARGGLWRAQTPQAFHAPLLRRAHERAAGEGFEATDDSALVEWMGEPVAIVPGDERNLKVTSPEELALAEALLAAMGRRTC